MSIKSTKNNLKKFRRNKLALALLSVLPWVAAGANDVSIKNNAFTSPRDGFTVETVGAVQTILQDNQFISIEWSQFNIGKNETVEFLQPNINSVALNKITSLNGSTIAGNLEANGTVILVNPNGIIFTPDSKIDVGGLVASGLSIETDISSINEKLNLFLNYNNAQGVIRNQGTIKAKNNGIALIGTNVVNTGTITSHVGQINLIAGKDAVISFSQNGLISVSLKKIIEDAGEGVPSGDSIEGIVLLTEDQKQDIFSNAVNHEGLDASPSVIVHGNGSFTIGDIENNGDIIYQSASLDDAQKKVEISSNIDGSSNLSNTAVNIVANNNISLSGSIKLNHSGNINVEAGASIKAIRDGQDPSSKSLPDVSSNPEITQIDDEKVSANPVISTSGGELKLKAASIDITQLDLTTTGGNIRIESDENIQLGNINTSTSSNEVGQSGSGNLTIKVGSDGGSHNSSNYILTSEGNLAVGGKTLIEAINGSVDLNYSAEKTHNFLGGVAAKVAGGSFSISTQSSLNIDTNSNNGGFSGIEADSIEIKIKGFESARSQLEISGDLNSLADDGEVLINLNGYADALLARDKIYTSKIIIKGNSENNSVTALNVNNDWAISAKNSGSVSTDKNKYLEFENIDTLIGGAGNDHFTLGESGSFSTLVGGEGTDTLTGSNVDTVWTIGPDTNTLNAPESDTNKVAWTGTFSGIDALNGGDGNNTFTLNTHFAGTITGGDGNDHFTLGEGGSFSTLVGGEGTDTLTGSNVDTVWTIGTEANTISAKKSTDSVAWVGQFSGIDALNGGDGNNTFTLNTHFAGTITGGAGNDHFTLGEGGSFSTLVGGEGTDTLTGSNVDTVWTIG
ncbi:MAG: filamentous hemagglutinin N-terminal domain-containing protein, partial [Cellvibrio sp.]